MSDVMIPKAFRCRVEIIIGDGVPVLVWGDALDGCGYRDRVLKPGLMPLDPSAGPVVGVAVPVLAEPTTQRPLEPYAKLFRVLEPIGPGQVVVATTQGSQDALGGELLSLRAQYRGPAGAVIDGMVRDRAKVRALGFPVIAAGSRPTDSNGRIEVVDYGQPVLIRGVRVEPGDIVVGERRWHRGCAPQDRPTGSCRCRSEASG